MLLLVVGTKKIRRQIIHSINFAAPENIFNQLKKNLNVVAGGWYKKNMTPDNSFDQLKQFESPENIFSQLKKKI